jgi:hypothetical protein
MCRAAPATIPTLPAHGRVLAGGQPRGGRLGYWITRIDSRGGEPPCAPLLVDSQVDPRLGGLPGGPLPSQLTEWTTRITRDLKPQS